MLSKKQKRRDCLSQLKLDIVNIRNEKGLTFGEIAGVFGMTGPALSTFLNDIDKGTSPGRLIAMESWVARHKYGE